jgi:hypothetical protein
MTRFLNAEIDLIPLSRMQLLGVSMKSEGSNHIVVPIQKNVGATCSSTSTGDEFGEFTSSMFGCAELVGECSSEDDDELDS